MDTERQSVDQWEYVGILVNGWKVIDWTSLTAFHLNDGQIKVGMHFVTALEIAGNVGWEMTAAHPDGNDVRYWFKRRIRT